ncbi:MAG: SDR family NAD(P)-dependent oxidoreductase [Alphaproteobacteria bacterium]|nr:SDR family NAD(P)-dependent oxidoreductase [Alphaproteobacteria bacterium]MBU1513193.1 SDR family NAD(P)-dependent oxidoreductase [Alphaproteobacteria bacterium]MBU2095301.1 SDR family NAD(P)-dependent oxidoreductase [Alphaproteobacteria bacterium]MBU2152216.1 SDR family NAD(P)-dependent oxidoreductase [Alphaproteobacteria bacterium]MBU2306737.1 SDR family NAD(P)-dependent oxidoreductase [Alphaproteobacteria bacterium]
MRFSNQKIAVTGGAGEIGTRIVAQLLAEGAAVTVLDRQAPSRAGAGHIPCDLADPAGLERLAAAMGGSAWDVLINLAGVQYFGPMEGESPDSLRRTLAINLLAPMRLAQAVAPGMRARGCGQIVNIGSIFGSINFAHFASYSSSKAGLRAFSQALRRELAGSGVDVTYIAPRAVKTAFNSPKVVQFAAITKTAMDDPDMVAGRIVDAIAARRTDVYLGFPEAFFVRLNALFPALVDRALAADDRKVSRLFA